MDERWSAPAKVNLALRVGRPRSDGYHPLESIVQAIDWVDDLKFGDADEDALVIDGADLPTDGDNLVWKAIDALSIEGRRALRIELTKRIPSGAGLGGGSSDAACVIAAMGERHRVPNDAMRTAARNVGADVTFFLTGGTARMEGIGERITPLDALSDFVVVVVAPPYGLSTATVYRTWDRLGCPLGRVVEPNRLPPSLRTTEIVNDLTPAATALEPALGDLINELSETWERPVMMSGSGSAVFGCFADLDEASDAASAAARAGASSACGLEPHGVRRLDR
jgi:4-diphosphocytidyl-2-C-methyl-D-erythritol kinase